MRSWLHLALLLVACGGTTEVVRPPEPARLVVENPTVDALDVRLGPEPRGSIPPSQSVTLAPIRPGRWTLLLESPRSGLVEDLSVELGAGETRTIVATRQLAALRVDNPHAVPVEVAIDGVVYGVAAAATSTLIPGAPAGRRTIVLKALGGPGAVRFERRLPVGPVSLEVPALAGPVVAHELPRPPDGMGLVRMRNESRFAATLFVDGVDRGLVETGGMVDVVLSPGEHHLEVRLEGLEARTEHRVTLRPNQAAEWIWGGPW